MKSCWNSAVAFLMTPAFWLTWLNKIIKAVPLEGRMKTREDWASSPQTQIFFAFGTNSCAYQSKPTYLNANNQKRVVLFLKHIMMAVTMQNSA